MEVTFPLEGAHTELRGQRGENRASHRRNFEPVPIPLEDLFTRFCSLTLLAGCYSSFPREGTQEEFAGAGSSCPSSYSKITGTDTWVDGSSCPLFVFYFKARN